jgi:hypothetical protein
VLAVSDVREEFVGEPKAHDLLGDLRTFGLDEGDPVPRSRALSSLISASDSPAR